MDDALLERIFENPNYGQFVRRRNRVAWGFSAVIVATFTAFMLAVALDKSLLAASVGRMVMSWGILAGLALIILAVTSIALFTAISNRLFDQEMTRIFLECGE